MRTLVKKVISFMLIIYFMMVNFSTIISYAIDNQDENSEISLINDYKSKLYENYYSDSKNEFQYVVNTKISITKEFNSTAILLDDDNDAFYIDDERIELDNNVYYDFTLIPVKKFNNIFGKSGQIYFYNGENLLGTIKADLNKSEDEYYIFKYDNEYSNISYKTTAPENDGELEIINQKTIKSDIVQNLDYEVLRQIKQIVSNTNVRYEYIEQIIQDNPESDFDNEESNIQEDNKESSDYQEKDDKKVDVKDKEANNLSNDENSNKQIDSNGDEIDLLELENSVILENNNMDESLPQVKQTEIENIETITELKEPTTDIDLILNENTIYTLDENKLEFTLILKNSSYENELFENPIIEIELPKEIDYISIDKVMLLYKNGLSLSRWNIKEDENEIKYLCIELEGMQNQYQNSEIIDGTNIIIETTIKPYDITPIMSTNLKLRYENSGRNVIYKQEEKDCEEIEIDFMSKYGLMLLSGIENESIEEAKQLALGETIKSIPLNMDSDKQKINYDMAIVNNYTESLENVEIIGSFPIENNDKLSENELINTFSSRLLTTIGTQGVENQIYYSNEINPQSNSESWTKNYEELDTISSYKIQIGTLNPKDTLKFDYETEVPEGLSYNQSVYSLYEVSYKYDGQDYITKSIVGAKTETKEVTYEDCQVKENTGVLDVGIYASKGRKTLEDAEEVHEGQIIKYSVVLTNSGTTDLENIDIQSNIINGNYYELRVLQEGEYLGDPDIDFTVFHENISKENEVSKIDLLKTGEMQIYTIQAVIRNKGEDSDNNIFANFILNYNDEQIQYTTVKNKIKDSNLNIKVCSGNTENLEYYEDKEIKINLSIDNNNINDFENVEFSLKTPDSINFETEDILHWNKDIEVNDVEQKDNNKIYHFNVKNLEKQKSKTIVFIGKSDVFDYNKEKFDSEFICTAKYNNETYYSNNYIKEINPIYTTLEYEYKADKPNNEKVSDGDKINVSFKIKNTNILDAILTANIVIPDGIECKQIDIYRNDEYEKTEELENDFKELNFELKPQDVVDLKYVYEVNENKYMYGQEEITSYIEIFGNIEEPIVTKSITFLIDNNMYPTEIIEDDFIDSDIVDSPDINEDDKFDGNEEIDDITNTIIDKDDYKDDESKKDDTISSNIIENNTNEIIDNKTFNTSNNKNTVKISSDNNSNTNYKNDNRNISNSKTAKNKGTISGNVWLDTNNDGLKNEIESVIPNIKVKLYKTSSALSTIDNYIEETQVNTNGDYTFSNIEEGSYVVLFEYDTDIYKITTYSTNSNSFENSIAIEKQISGKTYGITNIIKVSDNEVSKVNLGLVYKDVFDFKIDNKISKVIVKNGHDDRENIYADTNLVKEEISSKYIDGTKITIEYEFTITNVGDVDGYVNQVDSYIPNDFVFNQDLNKDWNLKSGILTNTSLSNTVIKAGENKKIKLVLIKTMNENNTGTFENKAMISQITNSRNIEDSNLKNNESISTIILTIKTGRIVVYTFIVIFILLIFGIGIYIIKFKF